MKGPGVFEMRAWHLESDGRYFHIHPPGCCSLNNQDREWLRGRYVTADPSLHAHRRSITKALWTEGWARGTPSVEPHALAACSTPEVNGRSPVVCSEAGGIETLHLLQDNVKKEQSLQWSPSSAIRRHCRVPLAEKEHSPPQSA